jgi:hypothetical protein
MYTVQTSAGLPDILGLSASPGYGLWFLSKSLPIHGRDRIPGSSDVV